MIATNGGFRKLNKPNSPMQDVFIGQKSTKATRFRFDFVKPLHCITDGNCSQRPFSILQDITKVRVFLIIKIGLYSLLFKQVNINGLTKILKYQFSHTFMQSPLAFFWDGWSDDMSGVHGFSIQEFLLKPNHNVQPNLTEPDPWHAKNTFQLDVDARSFHHTPSEPGMYSYILNVMDTANNTEFARSLVLYDPDSTITLANNSSSFAVASGVKETNYTWQDNLDKSINAVWKGHFRNKFHEENKLLIPVSTYMNYDFYTMKARYVLPLLDDMDGNRTLKGIKNVHGIVRFEYAYRNANQGTDNPSVWSAVGDIFSETQTFNLSRRDGDGINIWIKATDIMGNTKIDRTQIYFDSTPPRSLIETDVLFTRNTNISKYPFSSR